MKKYTHYSILLISLLCLLFAACSQEPIFYDLEKEIAQVEATIVGNVYSLVPCSGKLYVTNGRVYVKTSGWSDISNGLPGSVIRLASDDTTVYAMTRDVNAVYSYMPGSGAEWKQVPTNGTVIELFDNKEFNKPDLTTGSRNAYITIYDGTTYEVQKLDNDNPPTTQSSATDATGSSGYIIAAVGVNGTDYFSSNAMFVTDNANLYTIAPGDTELKYKVPTATEWTTGPSVSSPAISLAINDENELLVGLYSDYEIITQDILGIPNSVVPSKTNSASSFRHFDIIGIWYYDKMYVSTAATGEASGKLNKLWSLSEGKWKYE